MSLSHNAPTLKPTGGVQCSAQPQLFFVGKNGNATQSQAGGKYRRIARFYQLIRENAHMFEESGVKVVLPTVSCIQTGCFDKFVDGRGQNLRIEAAEAGSDAQIVARFLSADFTKSQTEELGRALARHEGPIMLRASTLWEDANHVSVNDLFASIFLPNNDADPEVNFKHFLQAIKRLYAGAFSSKAREQAVAQGLLPSTVQMAVVIQDAPGRQTSVFEGRTYHYPEYSFYANSFNDYAYNGLNPRDGYFKWVFGLGTGIKTGAMNHALRVNLGAHPTFAGLKSDRKMYGQRPTFAYALSLGSQPRLEGDGNGNLAVLGVENLSDDVKARHRRYYNDELQKLEDGAFSTHGNRHEVILFKPEALFNKPGSITSVINTALQLLKKAYGSDVGFEGSADMVDGQSGPELVVYPLDAHLQPKAWDDRLQFLPEISDERIVFRGGRSIGRGRYKIGSIVQVSDEFPSYHYGFSIADELLQINKELKNADGPGQSMLLSPGRIGSRVKGEGIPVGFEAVDNFAVLAELISGESMPSQGGHFFQDVVANHTACTSYSNAGALNAANLQIHAESVETRQYSRIYHLSQPLEFVIDEKKDSLLYAP
jgi:hypothetical protein